MAGVPFAVPLNCMGPNVIDCTLICRAQRLSSSQHEITLRDQDTVDELSRRLGSARRVVIVGNGGIALELVHVLKGIEACVSRGRLNSLTH